MRTSKTEKLAEKLASVRAEYKEAKKAEAQAARKDARREFTKAARRAGLLALVGAGTLSASYLEAEFRGVVDRLKKIPVAPEEVPAEASPTSLEQESGEHKSDTERKSFWAR